MPGVFTTGVYMIRTMFRSESRRRTSALAPGARVPMVCSNYDSQVEDYAKTYSNMKPQEAASIFDTMTDNLGLVADILMNMGTQQRADILGKMDATTAAKLTEIMEPSKKK